MSLNEILDHFAFKRFNFPFIANGFTIYEYRNYLI